MNLTSKRTASCPAEAENSEKNPNQDGLKPDAFFRQLVNQARDTYIIVFDVVATGLP